MFCNPLPQLERMIRQPSVREIITWFHNKEKGLCEIPSYPSHPCNEGSATDPIQGRRVKNQPRGTNQACIPILGTFHFWKRMRAGSLPTRPMYSSIPRRVTATVRRLFPILVEIFLVHRSSCCRRFARLVSFSRLLLVKARTCVPYHHGSIQNPMLYVIWHSLTIDSTTVDFGRSTRQLRDDRTDRAIVGMDRMVLDKGSQGL